MDLSEPGLHQRLHRVLRQMESQHHDLKLIDERMRKGVATEEVSPAQSAFDTYRDALAAHFSLEDEFFFPALHGLFPERSSELGQLVREHQVFLEELCSIGAMISAGQFERCGRALTELAARLTEHEVLEERFVTGIETRGDTRTAPTNQNR
jgi:hypothetical protein